MNGSDSKKGESWKHNQPVETRYGGTLSAASRNTAAEQPPGRSSDT